MPEMKEMLEELAEMWTPEFGELELHVNHCLTEPTYPTAIIRTEEPTGPRWRADRDTIEDAVRIVTIAAYITLVERKPKPMTFPAPDLDEDDRLARFFSALDKREI